EEVGETAGAATEPAATEPAAAGEAAEVELHSTSRAAGTANTGAAGAEDLLPTGRRLAAAFGLLPGLAELVVLLALVGVLQDLVGLGDLLEAVLGPRLFRDVGMELTRQLAVGALDLLLGRRPLDAERLVVVLVLHLLAPAALARR